ncbi:MAG: thioredoxin family protein [Firmicutes bacterium]|nr:thioredoxin family protein [Bacillota bacterium]
MSDITYLTEETYGPVTTGSTAAVVDFYADWCGPCQMMAPVFDACALEYDKIAFCKVNVDEHKKLAIQNRVLGIPCFLFFKNGKMLKRIDGAVSETAFRDALNMLL